MNEFTKQNTGWRYSFEELAQMNRELAKFLNDNGVSDDDDTLQKHYAEKVIESH